MVLGVFPPTHKLKSPASRSRNRVGQPPKQSVGVVSMPRTMAIDIERIRASPIRQFTFSGGVVSRAMNEEDAASLPPASVKKASTLQSRSTLRLVGPSVSGL